LRALVPIALACTLLACPAHALTDDWVIHRSQTGRFRVLLPAAPSIDHTTHPTLIGPIRQTRETTATDRLGLVVEHHLLPMIATLLMPDSVILDQAVDSLIEDVNGNPQSDRSLSWQGYSGREVRYEIAGPPDMLEQALFVLVGRRLYLVLATWPSDGAAPPELPNFFHSFEISTDD
jgi:hypothetical protein